MFRTRFFIALGLVSLAALTASAQTTATATRTFNFPPFGLGSTETARISLTNIAAAAANGTAASCTGSVSFLNSAGATIGTATTFTIASGQTSSASLPFASAGLSGARGEIRAVLQLTRANSSPAPCSLLTSLQTFDTSSGATHLYLSGEESFAVPLGRR
jgi:hypothetical protein